MSFSALKNWLQIEFGAVREAKSVHGHYTQTAFKAALGFQHPL
jgi:hypothetical protein